MYSYRDYTTGTRNYLGPLRRKIDYWAESLTIRRTRLGVEVDENREARNTNDE